MLIASVLPSAVLPLGMAQLAEIAFAGRQWPNPPLHALLEGTGALAAIVLSLFVLVMRQNGQLRPNYLWLATTLMAMGTLDSIHAALPPGQAFVWLHSLATLAGGICFALVALPERIAQAPRLQRLPFVVAGGGLLLGLSAALLPQYLPTMLVDGRFSLLAESLNVGGGIGFLVAWRHFVVAGDAGNERERTLLASHCLLLGMAALLFHVSILWDGIWWLWHILRVIAYLVILAYFFDVYTREIGRIRERERALLERTVELEDARRRLADIIEFTPSALALKDLERRYTRVNPRFEKLFGVTESTVIGRTPDQVLSPVGHGDNAQLDRQVIASGMPSACEESLRLADGVHTFITARFPLIDGSGQVYGLGSIRTDISERKRMEERLHLARMIIASTSQAVLVTDSMARVIEVNEAYVGMTGFPRQAIIGRTPSLTRSGYHDTAFYRAMWQQLLKEGHWAGEIWDRTRDGQVFPQWLRINAIRNDSGETTHYVGFFSDISAQKAKEEHLRNLAFYDPLTKLPNRAFFHERLSEAIAYADRHATRAALLFIDLDRFKAVNDSLGHLAGDQLIIQAGQRIQACLRKTDTVARLGGDEFTVIQTEVEQAAAVEHVVGQIVAALCAPFDLFGETASIGASIGIAIYPDDAMDGDTLIELADRAMYGVKERGRGDYRFAGRGPTLPPA